MPPRKKARPSQATSPSPSVSRPKSPETAAAAASIATATAAMSQHSASSPNKLNEPTIIDDPWSDHEEIGLFKGLMIWKPTGIHKHFRLLALHNWLLENHYIHPKNQHTKPKGIRAKLETMYSMDALDAREDARQLPALELPDAEQSSDARDTVLDDDIYSEADNRIEEDEFALPPEEGFEKEMWDRRLPVQKEGDESDPELSELNLDGEPPVRFVATVSIEPSEAATPGSRKGKAAAGAKRKRAPRSSTRRSARQVESAVDEEEAAEEEEEKEDEGGDEEEEEIENSSEDQSQASTPAPRSTRTSKGTRGRGRGRSKRGRK